MVKDTSQLWCLTMSNIISVGFGKTLSFEIPSAEKDSPLYVEVIGTKTTNHLLKLPTKEKVSVKLRKAHSTKQEVELTAEAMIYGDAFLDYNTVDVYKYEFHSII